MPRRRLPTSTHDPHDLVPRRPRARWGGHVVRVWIGVDPLCARLMSAALIGANDGKCAHGKKAAHQVEELDAFEGAVLQTPDRCETC